jgi:predicted phosphodiesterase
MEVIIKTIVYRPYDTFHLFPFSDSHLGARESAEAHLIHRVAECTAYGRCGLAVGVGDWVDSITKNDKRFRMNGLATWVEKSNIIQSQRKRACEVYSPLVEAGQLLEIGTGNHEEEIHHRHDDDITRNICSDLKVPYGGYTCFLILIFKSATTGAEWPVTIHAWHGAGAAQTEGARLNRLMRLVNDIQADIYLMGHLHAMTSHTPDKLVCRNGVIKSEKLAATITGSWLKTYMQPTNMIPDVITGIPALEKLDPSYGEEKGYKPSRIGSPVINITPDKFSDPYDNAFEVVS